MSRPVVIVGMGEVGELFGRGFLKMGVPVFPVLRGTDVAALAREVPVPELVLVAVGEDDLCAVLETLPVEWRGRLGLVQNELLPCDWERHGIADPTVAVIWFDKKKGRPFVAVQPTPVGGPAAGLTVAALRALEVPAHEVAREALLYELARKNLYILTINIAGIRSGGTVGELWTKHRDLALAVFDEVLAVQEWRAGLKLPRERLLKGVLAGFEGDPDHICTGRSAPRRLGRALELARAGGVDTPVLREIAADLARGTAAV